MPASEGYINFMTAKCRDRCLRQTLGPEWEVNHLAFPRSSRELGTESAAIDRGCVKTTHRLTWDNSNTLKSRCGAVAVGASQLFAAPFGWRCRNRRTMAPFPHPAYRTGRARLRHPALGQDIMRSPTEGCASRQAVG